MSKLFDKPMRLTFFNSKTGQFWLELDGVKYEGFCHNVLTAKKLLDKGAKQKALELLEPGMEKI